ALRDVKRTGPDDRFKPRAPPALPAGPPPVPGKWPNSLGRAAPVFCGVLQRLPARAETARPGVDDAHLDGMGPGLPVHAVVELALPAGLGTRPRGCDTP